MRLMNNQDVKEIYRGFLMNDAHLACERVRSIIDCIEHTVGLNGDQSFDIRVILSELIQNAIKHGNMNEHPQRVFMRVLIKEQDNLVITVRDQGEGFNPEKILKEEQKQVSNGSANLREYGRGLQIVKSLCDHMIFNRRGNCITISKKLH